MSASETRADFEQRYFTGGGRRTRIARGATRCVRRHFAHTIDPLGLPAGARVLELGCGIGRFTELLLDRGHAVTALDVSTALIARLREDFADRGGLTAIAGAAEHAAELVTGPFDAVVGFFFLHHLGDLAATFQAARRVLRAGGQIAFCEPNAFNPLVYLQVTFTPGMRWRGERAIPKMRPSVVFPLLRRAGFDDPRTSLYGALPPIVANTAGGAAVERAIESVAPLRPFSAYRVFHARAAGSA